MKITIEMSIDELRELFGGIKINEEKTEGKSTEAISQYARFFDEGCRRWRKDSVYNMRFLKYQQMYANDLLRARGHLYLNEVYDMLGIPRSKVGQIVGWIYDERFPYGDNFVDFDLDNPRNADFINGYKSTVLLDFNVDGRIDDKI